MAPSSPTENNAGLEHANLLCNEDACACFYDGDDDDETPGNASEKCNNDDDDNDDDSAYNFDSSMSMFVQEESVPLKLQMTLGELFEREKQYLPHADFALSVQSSQGVDVNSRRKAVSWLLKMSELFKFCSYTASLSINYFDRFLSLHQLPSGKAWTLQLLSVACLSLAAKMEEIEVPLLLDLQVGADLVFEPRTIQRMELLVLSTLDWKMSSITPISYLSYFLRRLDLDSRTKRVLISRVNELVLSSSLEIRFLRFVPSSIAAAATLCAFQETLPLQFAEQRRYLLCLLPYQSQVELMNCYALMMELFSTAQCLLASKEAESSVPQSPVAVLDASFSSNSMSNVTMNCHSCPPISSPSPPKKRRMDAPS
ncbi:hypothetical protein GOP47_0030092 [Adiantum capillus-veneris]|nr:hypothetical protein GOP47_0030092 [Adiantum capillus-veneris]